MHLNSLLILWEKFKCDLSGCGWEFIELKLSWPNIGIFIFVRNIATLSDCGPLYGRRFLPETVFHNVASLSRLAIDSENYSIAMLHSRKKNVEKR